MDIDNDLDKFALHSDYTEGKKAKQNPKWANNYLGQEDSMNDRYQGNLKFKCILIYANVCDTVNYYIDLNIEQIFDNLVLDCLLIVCF